MKRTFYTIIYVYLIVFGSILTGHAMPAYPKPIEVIQPDGTKLTILLKGDEYFHYAQSMDGYILKQNQKGFYTFATLDTEGLLQSSDVVARNIEDRKIEEADFLKTIKPGLSYSGTAHGIAIRKRMKNVLDGNSMLRSASAPPPGLLSSYPTTGSPKSLVILVNFKDITFKSENNSAAFRDKLNRVDYSQNNYGGSVRDFYIYNSNGKFAPEFVLVGPVTISNYMGYYGGNDSDGNDLRPAEMVYEACQKADSLVNFANFDYDNDGVVDNVYVYYAGKGEADGGSANTIWPHSWSLASANLNLNLDGKTIKTYACSGELDGRSGLMTSIGTFTHEYGHILGLTDMYDVDYDKYNGQGFDLNNWSLMAYGSYNNNGNTPPCLTLAERYLLGWATPVELKSSQSVTLTDLGSTGDGYIIKTSDSGEYFLLENRQRLKNEWDYFLPQSGMLIYHLDMRENDSLMVNYWGDKYSFRFSEMWRYNMVNAVAAHQCCDIEEADNDRTEYDGSNSYVYLTSLKGDPFPGPWGADKFSDVTTPSMRCWNGSVLTKPITDIIDNNGIIQFNFMDFSGFTKPLKTLKAKSVEPFSFTANWNSVINATGYYVDVYTQDLTKNPIEKNYLNHYQDTLVLDTFLMVRVPKDMTTYYYQVRATINNEKFTPVSDSIFLTTTDGTPVLKQATLVDKYTFRANWQTSSYAKGYFLDVFSVDTISGDTTWVDGFKNYYLTNNYQILSELEDQTQYQYRVRATNGFSVSRNSPVITVSTTKASEILAYVKDHVLYLKGMDKGGKVVLHYPDGRVGYSANVNHIAVSKPGIYIVTATFDGKVKHLKLLVQ